MSHERRTNPSGSTEMTETGAIERLRASVQRLEHSERLQRALFAIADMAASGLDMQRLLEGLHRIVSQLMYAENFYIALHDPQRETVRFVYFSDVMDGQVYRPDQEFTVGQLRDTITLRLIRRARPMRGSSDEIARALGLEQGHGVGTPSVDFMAVPMCRDGQVFGILAVQSYEEGRGYTQSDEHVLAFVAGHVLNAVERKLGQEALERRVAERTRELALANDRLQEQVRESERAVHLQATLYRIAALGHGQDSNEAFYRSIHQAVGELLNAESFCIALVSDDGQWLDFPYYVDSSGAELVRRPMGRGMSEYAIRCARTLRLEAEAIGALIEQGEVDAATYGTPAVSWLGAPLMGARGVMGVVVVQSYRSDLHYTQQDAELLTFVSYQIASTLQRRQQAEALQALNAQLEQRVQERTQELRRQIVVRERAQKQLKHQVMHDSLTGLPNRLYLRERLERALGAQKLDPARSFALLYLDVDRFKLFNDGLGHGVGDEVLRIVSARMADCVRAPDIVGRLSGDEFAVLLENCPQPSSACLVAERIQARMAEAIEVGGRQLHVSVSIGIAMSRQSYRTVDQLLHDADTALYRAKAAGRQRFVLFDEALHASAMNVLDLEQQMRVALEEEQFMSYFQPIVRLADGDVTGYEALIRWRHPEYGVLGPGQFLPAAEETGLIETIDWHMYRLAFQAAPALLGPDKILNINISPCHFHSRNFPRRLLDLAAWAGVAVDQLCVEVTESSLLSDPDAAAEILGSLHEAGVRIALDDFGTGYSSLSHVHRFPLRTLKIDRSFIAPLGLGAQQRSTAIVSAVLSLAASLDLDVVAEGVESTAQRDVLLSMGCVHAQGFLFGRPAPATGLP
ncbi:Diguanylate cyclase (GGDEF)-like protein OS=Castellaniella defragrans OX=75697 GN=HNR28_000921 PE=4 SV=1 [Castellaniella denitrificans]|uniref:bifunctional diguanylate cyclase/phosphodiesterase n=1 Tax=Castellaniella sp. TaxID=1955812 RepID=UPI002AFFC1C0|nr:EAL domain-containing protein [Castellaniella sp.]